MTLRMAQIFRDKLLAAGYDVLMTRGFSLEDARLIVVEALIRPLIDRLDESVREEVLAEVRRKLDTKEK